tara:strand:+ start:153 stop:509 length:357 start_codon:yes stop_codon:yes gene_type:complete
MFSDFLPSIQAGYTNFQSPMDSYVGSGSSSGKNSDKLQESGQEFEAILWRQVLEPALGPVLSQKNDASSDIQRSFMIQALANNLSQSIDLGFSTMLQVNTQHLTSPSNNSIQEKKTHD